MHGVVAVSHSMRRPLVLACPADLGSGKDGDQRVSILIVEDDFLVASDVEHALREAGYNVAGIAVSAAEALMLAERLRPAIAIMDVRLVGKRDGVDTALDLFRNHNIRCIFTTAHSDEDTRCRASQASPLGWLAKPYNPDALVQMLKRILAD